jgi:hypothetical protein
MRYGRRCSVAAIVGALVLAGACGNARQSPAKQPPAEQLTPAKAAPAQTPAVDLQAVAKALVDAGMVKTGDTVLVAGSARDNDLLESIAIEVMRAGGITIGVGDNTAWGGSNASDFSLAGAVGSATLSAGGMVIVDKGVLR